MPFTPDPASLRQHSIPAWYDEAKFGIFVHWTPTCIPAWAPTGKGDYHEVIRREGFAAYFLNNPYSEWYQNGLRLGAGPVWEHHRATWGADYPYERFADAFNESLERWDPDAMAGVFAEAGARYVVLVTKHHDGFTLWPSAEKNPRRPGYHARRDVVGELSAAVRRRGMRMGLYYSGALDWTFGSAPIRVATDTLATVDPSPEYGAYAHGQMRELVDRHRPSVLWNDIAYPEEGRYLELLAAYYATVPEGVVNDRWMPTGAEMQRALANPVIRSAAGAIARRIMLDPAPSDPGVPFDYSTLEYNVARKVLPRKWECVRGIGKSFGYTANEPEDGFLRPGDGVRLLAHVASTNGNLLLNVGPGPGGWIQDVQLACIRGMGAWLAGSGEAIYGTRPWKRPEGRTSRGGGVRFTAKGADLYAIVAEPPADGDLVMRDLPLPPGVSVTALPQGPGSGAAPVTAAVRGRDLLVRLPAARPDLPLALKIAGGNRKADGTAIRLRELPRGQLKAPKTVAALVRGKTVGALAVIAFVAAFLALFGFNPATSGSAAWSLAFAAASTFVLAVLLPLDQSAQARKELFRGRVVAGGADLAASPPARARSLLATVLPRILPAALAATAAAAAPVWLLGRAGIVLPPAATAALVAAASFACVALVLRRLLPRVVREAAPYVLAPAASASSPGWLVLLAEHVVPRLTLMAVVNLALGAMIAAGQAAAAPTIAAAAAQQSWGITFLVLVVFCHGAAGDQATGDVWSGRQRSTSRRGRIPGLLQLAMLVAVSYAAGFVYQVFLDFTGTAALSPWDALAHKMIGVAVATVLGCWIGVSWYVPRASRKVRDRVARRG